MATRKLADQARNSHSQTYSRVPCGTLSEPTASGRRTPCCRRCGALSNRSSPFQRGYRISSCERGCQEQVGLGSGSQPGGWARWISAAVFAAVLLCFFLPFASTSCTLPGGYGNGAQGTSTVYHGTDFLTGSEPSLNQNGVPPSHQPESGVVLGLRTENPLPIFVLSRGNP